MVNLFPLTPIGLRDLFARRSNAEQPQERQNQKKNPLESFPSSTDLETYPPPASFVVDGKVCDQRQSPLFGKIPPELRNEIFRLALSEYVPKGREWNSEKMSEIKNSGYGNVKETASYVRRPGYEGLKTVDTDLLRTCKRIYEETKLLPLQDLEVCFYVGHKGRVPKPYTMSKYTGMNTYAHPRVNWFKPEHWLHIHHYHIVGQMYALEQGFRGLFRNNLDLFHPTSITLTLRYTDWWYWEFNEPIYPIRPDRFFPMRDIELPSTVQNMTVEFENIEPKLKELKAVVAEMFQRRDYWVWKRRDKRELVVRGDDIEGGGVKTWSWTGPTRFGGRTQKFAHHGEGESMSYVVKVVTWSLPKTSDE